MMTKVISFYSDIDGRTYYSDHAKRLKKDLDNLNQDYYIEELPSSGDYRSNCLKKPRFILETFKKLKEDVIWLDIDSIVHQNLSNTLTSFMEECDITGAVQVPPIREYFEQNGRALITKIKASPVVFKYKPEVVDFVETWAEDCDENLKNGNKFDHEVLLDITIPRFIHKLRWGLLDIRYCTWPGSTDKNTIITMGIADGDTKRKGLENMGLSEEMINVQLIGNERLNNDYASSGHWGSV